MKADVLTLLVPTLTTISMQIFFGLIGIIVLFVVLFRQLDDIEKKVDKLIKRKEDKP